MFQMLDDPNPPVPTPKTLACVKTRARLLRRRRNAIAAAPAALALGATGVFLPRLRDHGADQVASTPSSLPFGSAPTVVSFDDRGERMALDPPPSGYTLASESLTQRPDDATFTRVLEFTRVDAAGDDTANIVITRVELRARDLTEHRLQVGEALSTPIGRDIVVRHDGERVSATWYLGANLLVMVDMRADNGLDPAAVLDALSYQAPDTSCVVGNQVVVVPECDDVEIREAEALP